MPARVAARSTSLEAEAALQRLRVAAVVALGGSIEDGEEGSAEGGAEVAQPPLPTNAAPIVLCAVLGSLAIGGAERIVLDWAARHRQRYRLRLFVIHRVYHEWPIPRGVEVVRPARGQPVSDALQAFAAEAAAAWAAWQETAGRVAPVVLCHMTRREHRLALEAGGARAVPVLHNAREGWREPFEALPADRRLVAVSQACVDDLAALGRCDAVTLIRHIPSPPSPPWAPSARSAQRASLCQTLAWRDDPAAPLVAMVGAVKPQKNYGRALRILAELAADPDDRTRLVIFGGPVGAGGDEHWRGLCAEVLRLDLQERVRLPGFVPGAARLLPAFDLLLNTSDFEGLSIATLEALQAQVPVVAASVGGQGELASAGLTLVDAQASAAEWAGVIRRVAHALRPAPPAWSRFPSHRLWTLEHLAAPAVRRRHVMWVTANLNAGGAQRSLVNLATHWARHGSTGFSFEVVVTGESTTDWFFRQLAAAGVAVTRSAAGRDCFDHAEALMQRMLASGACIVGFWNVDPKIKLLVAKAAPDEVRLVDVSPGGYAFEEMRATATFQQLIGFDESRYYARLARLVMKFHGAVPAEVACPTAVVRNGVPAWRPTAGREGAAARVPRIVVNGRIAPSKFVAEIIGAMALVWRRFPAAALHLIGAAEPRHHDYARQCVDLLAPHLQAGRPVHLHGAGFELQRVAGEGDIGVVLGHHQGCPNAVLEAMAVGMAVVANDSGGTAEAVLHERTGLLIEGHDPATLAAAIERLLAQPAERTRLGQAGRAHVGQTFSMDGMAHGYLHVFQTLLQGETACA